MKIHVKTVIFLHLALLLLIPASCTIKLPDFTKIHPLVEKKVSGTAKEKILIIKMKGTLTQTDYIKNLQGRPRINLVARIKEELKRAEKDLAIKALVLMINSPGGEVTAADIIFHELEIFKSKRDIPIITSFGAMGASGAYYIAMTSDSIVAQPTSIVGSIGVVINSANLTGLMKKLGIEAVTFKSGKFKDMGSPLKAQNREENEIFESVVDSLHQQFVAKVVKGRGLSKETVEKIANGRIFTATQALDHGLIDNIGYIEDAIALAQKKAGLHSASVIMYRRTNEFRENVYNQSQSVSYQLLGMDLDHLLFNNQSQLFYLWQKPVYQ